MKTGLSCLLVAVIYLLSACTGDSGNENENRNILFANLKKDTSIRYARRFSIAENDLCKVIYLFGSVDIKDTAATYIILKKKQPLPEKKQNQYVLNGPCKKIASLSSVYTSMFCELKEEHHLIAIENIDYYTNKIINDKFSKGELAELSKGPKIDVEKTILLTPDIIFTFGMGNPEKDVNEKIIKAGIPMVITVDHLEETPLARAEWIKFFAAFTNKERKADSLFSIVESNYVSLKKLAAQAKESPTVFSEIKFGEIWYVPGGKSFAATFFNDAHATYVWKDNLQTGSLHLGFEEVFVRAGNADFWLNMALVKTKTELVAQEPRYAQFKAFKSGKLYNNIKTLNEKGYSDYWETGIIFPDKVLHDLISIFHPELPVSPENHLYYYKKLD